VGHKRFVALGPRWSEWSEWSERLRGLCRA